MIKCNDCDKSATHIFKAHMPLTPLNKNAEGSLVLDREEYELNRKYAHKINIFFCDDCAVNDPLYFDKQNNAQLRYVKMRTVKVVPDTLSDTWEKQWTLLYEWEGEYILVEPRAQVYYVTAPTDTTREGN